MPTEWRKDVRAIRSLADDRFNEDGISQIGEALATADAAHWRRRLASAKRTGARADYGQIGNLSEPLLY
jgi:hypothetical protein